MEPSTAQVEVVERFADQGAGRLGLMFRGEPLEPITPTPTVGPSGAPADEPAMEEVAVPAEAPAEVPVVGPESGHAVEKGAASPARRVSEAGPSTAVAAPSAPKQTRVGRQVRQH